MKRAMQKGFTLIELMIVVAVIAILAGYALPAFKLSQGKAQAGEAIQLMDSLKIPVAEYYNDQGVFPADNTAAKLPAPAAIVGKYTVSVTVANGAIIGQMKPTGVANGLENATFTLTPDTTSGGSIQWACTGSVAQFVPSTCR